MVLEGCMFLCEATIFVCSVLVFHWDMASDGSIEGFEDMAVYTALCSISTFFALAVTLSLLLIPTQVRSCNACCDPTAYLKPESLKQGFG
jgi:hypothetical protein